MNYLIEKFNYIPIDSYILIVHNIERITYYEKKDRYTCSRLD